MAEKEYVINGIRFASAIEYQNAKKEQEGIAYITQKNDMSDDKVVLALYNKFVQKNVFRTQIGHNFLKELQERLMRSDVINKSEVAKLPIYEVREETVTDKTVIKEVEEPVGKQNQQKVTTIASGEKKTSTVKAVATTAAQNSVAKPAAVPATKSSIHIEYTANRTEKSESDKKAEEYKRKYGWSLFINIVLVIVIITMAFITLNSNNVNILNYEEQLQNEYAAWAEELADKEAELNRRERELNIKTEN